MPKGKVTAGHVPAPRKSRRGKRVRRWARKRTRGDGLFVWTLCGLALFGMFVLLFILLE